MTTTTELRRVPAGAAAPAWPRRLSAPLSRLKALRRRLLAELRDPMLRNGHLLTLSSLLTSAVGVVFWAVAADYYPPEVIGSNTAAISLMMLIAAIAQLNLSSAMARFVPTAGPRTTTFVLRSYLVCSGGATLVASAAVAVVVWAWPGTEFLETPRDWVTFVLAAVAFVLFTVQESVLTALGRAVVVPIENLCFAVTKVLLVVLFAAPLPWHGIFASWAVALWLDVVCVTGYLFAVALPRYRRRSTGIDTLPPVRDLARFVTADYLGAVCSIGSMTLLPVLVIAFLDTEQNAYFAMAWTIAYSIHLVNTNLGVSLVVQNAASQAALVRGVRRVLTHGARILVPVVAGVAVLAPLILSVFGKSYRAGTTTLQLLVLAALPNLLVATAISTARARRRLRLILTVQGTQAVAALGSAAFLLPRLGLTGAAIAWLGTQTALALALLVRRDLWLSPSPRPSGIRRVGRVLAASRDLPLPAVLRAATERRRHPRSATATLPDLTGIPGARNWTVGRRIDTVTDIDVFLVGRTGGSAAAVLKASATPQGRRELTTARDVLDRVRAGGLPSIAALAPRILAFDAAADGVRSVESFASGTDLGALLAADRGRYVPLVSSAVAAIEPFAAASAESITMTDEHLRAWVTEPLLAIADMCGRIDPPTAALVPELESALRTALTDATVDVGGSHGDYCPGNIRVEGDRTVAVIDWGGAHDGRPRWLDALHLALTASALVEDREFGAVVGDRLVRGFSARERAALAASESAAPLVAADGDARRLTLLLTWLHHVAENSRKSERFGVHPVWWARNVLPVLRTVHGSAGVPLTVAPYAAAPVPPRPSVSVVICAYTTDRWSELVAAVQSVRAQTPEAAEVVVVIDHSPELLDRARSTFTDAIVVPNSATKGLSGARNTGVAMATGDVVAFLDDDAEAAPGWLAALADGYRTADDGTVIGVGGAIDPIWHGGRPAWFPDEFAWVVGCSYRGLPTEAATVRNHIGANMSLRRDVLVSSTGFESRLGRIGKRPLGCEETELCIRTSAAHPGSAHRYEPTARVRHHVTPERRTWAYFRSRCYAEGLSKALVSTLTGAGDALSSERAYVTSVIPRGVLRGVGDALRGRPAGLARAAAMIAGVLITASGYAVGRVRIALRPTVPAVPDGDAPAAGRDTRAAAGPALRLRTAAPYLGLPVAAAAWIVSLPQIDLSAIGDFGLIPLLPVTFWIGLAALLASFGVLVRRGGASGRLLTAQLVLLVAMLHATPSAVYGTLRYSWAWKHVGMVDFFLRHEGVDTTIQELSAYQNWPGFFTGNALFVDAGGLVTSLGYAVWAPLVWNLLFLGPIYLIADSATKDRRLIWATLAVFVLGSWVGQDYFAPQACAFFLYLTAVALTLRHLDRRDGVTGRDRIALSCFALIPMLAAIAPTHQLTPLMMVAGLGALAVIGRYRVLLVVLVVLGLTVAWDFTFAGDWLHANMRSIAKSIGSLGSNAESGFINLGAASPSQAVIAQVDRVHSAAIWGLALLGFIRLRRAGRRDITFALLALAPLPLVVTNDYGGEMVFRVYLFGLPFVAFYAAAALLPPLARPRHGGPARPWRRHAWAAALPVTLVLLVPGFAAGYYGKEQANYFTPDEVAAVQYLYGVAPRGSLLVSATSDYPWAFSHFEHYDYYRFALLEPEDRTAVVDDPIDRLAEIMTGGGHDRAFLVFTRSQSADVAMTGMLPVGALDAVEHAVATSPAYRLVYTNPDSRIYTLVAPEILEHR